MASSPARPLTLDEVTSALEASWDESTSAGGYTPERPSTGQCAVSALVIQDYFGGELLRAMVDGGSHYWNLVGDTEVDTTRSQFDSFEPVDISTRHRSYVLSFPVPRQRYELLSERVSERLRSR